MNGESSRISGIGNHGVIHIGYGGGVAYHSLRVNSTFDYVSVIYPIPRVGLFMKIIPSSPLSAMEKSEEVHGTWAQKSGDQREKDRLLG